MAGSKTRKLRPLPCLPLTGALTSSQRDEVRRYARALLHWQRTLRRWPSLASAPDATPFVSIYANGVLRGCFGSHEGSPQERLSRAFLRALEDSRFGLVQTGERGRVTAVVSYVRSMRLIDPARIDEELEPGRDGLGVVKAGRPSVIILPQVALDTGADARALLHCLAKKAGLKDWSGCTLFAFRTDDVVVRSSEQRAHSTEQTATARAAFWLAQLVGSDGAVTFAVDARKRQRLASGPMHHGRAAVLVRALVEQGDHPSATRRAQKWLRREIAKALGGQAVDGWPAEPAAVAGTLALAQMAGIDVRLELEAASRATELLDSPWHCAQVVAALGRDAPESLWSACLDDLPKRSWAPWTVLAARARSENEITYRASRALCDSIRSGPPHAGGCAVTQIPETALTALVVEALKGMRDSQARGAVRRARSFLRAAQLIRERIPARLDTQLADGAFRASPVAVDCLRCDIAAHALLALR
jgi:AMMECR1 domain-containing protein